MKRRWRFGIIGCRDAAETFASARDQRQPLLAVMATYASIRDGKPINLSEFDRARSTLSPLP